MASFVYNEGALQLQNGSISWTSDTIKWRAVAASVTPSKDDTSMTGYTDVAGVDKTLANCTRTKDTTNDRIVYDGDDPTAYASVPGSQTIGYFVGFKFVTNDAGSIPIVCHDVTNTATNGTDITYSFSSSGIFYTQQ